MTIKDWCYLGDIETCKQSKTKEGPTKAKKALKDKGLSIRVLPADFSGLKQLWVKRCEAGNAKNALLKMGFKINVKLKW